jgi:hypothetical protein
MRKVNIFFISIFLNLLKRIHPLNENIICFCYKTLIIFTLFSKGNLIKKGLPANYMNKFFIPYYIYSIFNHLDLNYIDCYMIVHHLCALNFLCRDKYSNNSVNLLHGNLVLADYPNVITEIISKYTGKERSNTIKNYCDGFFIVYKILFGTFNSYLYSIYCLNPKVKSKIMKQINSENINGADYEWDSMSNFTMFIMYIAIIFKIESIKKTCNNKYLDKFFKGACLTSFIIISRNLLMAGNNGNIINKNIVDNYSKTFNKMSIINIVVYYYKMMIKDNLLKNNLSIKYNENKKKLSYYTQYLNQPLNIF